MICCRRFPFKYVRLSLIVSVSVQLICRQSAHCAQNTNYGMNTAKTMSNGLELSLLSTKKLKMFGIEMDVNVSAFGQVFGLLCSANPNYRYSFWERERRQLIDNYCVQMAETDEWENSDFLRMFFFETMFDEETEETTKKMTRVHLKTGRTYRLGFAVKFGSVPVCYWRTCGRYWYHCESTRLNTIQFIQRGFIGMPSNQYHNMNFLFQTHYFSPGWSPNFRLLIA